MISKEEYCQYVEKYANMVLRISVNYCKSIPDAEDMVQEVFLKLYETNKDFQDDEYIKRWIIRVTINLCKNYLKSAWCQKIHFFDSANTEENLDNLTEFFEEDKEKTALYRAVKKLPEKYRSVVHLYYYEEYPIRDIAEILQKKETTIQTRLMRARNMLKEQLKGAWHDE